MEQVLADYLAEVNAQPIVERLNEKIDLTEINTPKSIQSNVENPLRATPNVDLDPVSGGAKPKKDLTIPQFHRRVLVFDTETSRLMPKRKRGEPFPPDSEYPYILQLSWMLYNVVTNELEEVVDEYVSIGKDVPIDPGSTAINGITREIVDAKGKPIVPLLVKFYLAYMKCDCIVAHNMFFDGEMIRKEMWRNRAGLLATVKDQDRVNMMLGLFTKKFNTAYHIETFCTMMSTIDLCGATFPVKPAVITDASANAILLEDAVKVATDELVAQEPIPTPSAGAVSPTTVGRKKWPRLAELYKTLFESEPPKDLHNSIIDVLVCLRCFLKVRGAKEMTEKYFMRLVSQYSRPSVATVSNATVSKSTVSNATESEHSRLEEKLQH